MAVGAEGLPGWAGEAGGPLSLRGVPQAVPAGGEGSGREVPQGAPFPPSAPLRGAGARAGREGPGVSQAAASGCLIPSWTADRAVPGKEGRGGVPSRAAPLWQERLPKRGPAAPRSRCGGRRAAGDEGLGPGDRLFLGKGKWTPGVAKENCCVQGGG